MQKEQEKFIVEKAKENPHHFKALYEKYFEQIFKFLLKRHVNIQDAEEVTSQTFLKQLLNLKNISIKVIHLAHGSIK